MGVLALLQERYDPAIRRARALPRHRPSSATGGSTQGRQLPVTIRVRFDNPPASSSGSRPPRLVRGRLSRSARSLQQAVTTPLT